MGVLTGVKSVAAGAYFVLALKTDGTVWAWGENDYGELGDGTTTRRLTPVPVKSPDGIGGLTDIVAIAAGSTHGLAIKSDGTLYGWGMVFFGSLGVEPGLLNHPGRVKGENGIGFLENVIAVAASQSNSLAVTSDGRVWAWGNNEYGQIGDGTFSPRSAPVCVRDPSGGGFLTGVSRVSAGNLHSVALKSDGTVFAWGYNRFANLGDGTTTNRNLPVQVRGSGGNGVLSDVVAITSGYAFNLVQRSDGTLQAWGYGRGGQLGEGATVSRTAPVTVQSPSEFQYLTDVAAIAAGRLYSNTYPSSLALLTDGTLRAWGDDRSYAELVPGIDGFDVLTDVQTIAAGTWHFLTIRRDGTVVAMGANGYGQLGTGNTGNPSFPKQVVGPNGVGFLTEVKGVAGGEFHSLAVKRDGTAWAWGNNDAGQVGDGTITRRTAPVQVKGLDGVGFLTDVTALTAGFQFSAALRSDGTVWVWGDNSSGQFGNGTVNGSTTPVQVKGPDGTDFLTHVVGISAGSYHMVALKSDGTVWAWGDNSCWQMGDGTTFNRTRPVQVPGFEGVGALTGIVAVAAGWAYSLALKADGTVWRWGTTGEGLNSIYRRFPEQVVMTTCAVAIAAGRYHSLAIEAPATIAGRVTLEEDPGVPVPVRFEFRPTNNGTPIVRTVFVGFEWTFGFADIPEGIYHVAAKADKWLQKVIRNVDTTNGNNALNLHFVLPIGDANNDNSIDVLDLDLLLQAFDSTPASSHWNEDVDFHRDWSVDVLDLDILLRNFDMQGDA